MDKTTIELAVKCGKPIFWQQTTVTGSTWHQVEVLTYLDDIKKFVLKTPVGTRYANSRQLSLTPLTYKM